MSLVKDISVTPPGGWTHVQAESGASISGLTYSELRERVLSHRTANGYTVVPRNIDEELQGQICKRLNPQSQKEFCMDLPVGRRTTVADIKRFWGTLETWLENPVFVSQEEADRRAGICTACPYNLTVQGCAICKKLVSAVTGTLAARSTLHDAGLQGCGICGCVNKVQVHIPLEAMDREGLEFPDWCWKKA